MKRTSFITFIAPLICSVFCHACSSRSSTTTGEYVIEKYTPCYASGFKITSAPGRQSSMITVINSWQGNDSTPSHLFISRNGEQPPAGYTGPVLNNQAMRIACVSSTYIAMLDALGAADRIVAASSKEYITTPSIVNRINQIYDIGFEGSFNYETLIASNPDLVLLYGIYGNSSIETKLTKLNIPYLYISDYLEESPLGKAEWIMAVAEVTGTGDKAAQIWEQIPSRYNRLKKIVQDSVTTRPRVMLNTPYGDSWFMPPSNSYMVTLITDAGGDYIYTHNHSGMSLPIDMEQAYMLTSECDYWLNTGTYGTIDELQQRYPRIADAPCVSQRHIYNNTRLTNTAGGNDFYESGVIHPDIILHDLVQIFHPSLTPADTTMTYYRRLE